MARTVSAHRAPNGGARGQRGASRLPLARAIASLVAREGARLVRISHAHDGAAVADRKAPDDPVTRQDRITEERLRRALGALLPDASFIGEESGARWKRGPSAWVVDPIDGTSNFAAGLIPFGVAVALLDRGRPLVAACFDARTGAATYAARGEGAWRGRSRLRIRSRPCNRPGPLALFGVQWKPGSRVAPHLAALAVRPGKVRTFGCTVSQLLAVAEGRFAAAVQDRARIWDVAAACLIAVEAGARVVDFTGGSLIPFPSDCLKHLRRDYPFLAGRRVALDHVRRRLGARVLDPRAGLSRRRKLALKRPTSHAE